MTDRILIVEDDPELGEELVRQMKRAGFLPLLINDGDKAKKVDPNEFAIILLDLMLPGTYGLDVLKHYRASSEVPVILLTARDYTADKVRGLSLGADDYVIKPFWPDELLARVQARLRRPVLKREGEGTLRMGTMEIDLDAHQVSVGGQDVELTPVEFEILAVLARRAGRAVTRAALVEHVSEEGRGGSDRSLDVHVSRLRKKLGAEGARVATVWGIGYRLEKDE